MVEQEIEPRLVPLREVLPVAALGILIVFVGIVIGCLLTLG